MPAPPDPPPGGDGPSRGPRWVLRLVEPSPLVVATQKRRSARLAAALGLVLLSTAVLYLAVIHLTRWFGTPASLLQPVSLIDLGTVLLLGVAYALARTRFHEAGALLGATVVSLAVWGIWAASDEDPSTLYYLSIGLILAGGILPFRTSLAFTAANLAAFTGAAILVPAAQGSLRLEYLYLGFFLLSSGALVQAGGYLYEADQRRLEERTLALAQSEGRFRAMAENLPQAVFVADTGANRVLYVSPAFDGIFGRPRHQLFTNPNLWLESIRADHRAEIQAEMARSPETATNRDFVVVWPDGTERVVRNRTFPIPDPAGRANLLAGISEDITADTQAQRVLEESNARLKETERFRLDMLNTVAHDLNSPLSPIRIYSKLLRGDHGATPEAREKALAIIDRNVEHIMRLVQDLHDVATLEAGVLKLRPAPHDVAALASAAVASFEGVAAAKGVAMGVTAPSPLEAEVDAQRITQVLYNLLSNAVKFTPAGGKVLLESSPVDGGVLLAVTDSGRGLEPAEIARLFRPFSQVHTPGETTERGTGLGLYICKGIVQGHGGRVWVESRGRGQGSTFKAWLPRSQAPP